MDPFTTSTSALGPAGLDKDVFTVPDLHPQPPPHGGTDQVFVYDVDDEEDEVVEVTSSSWLSCHLQKRKREKDTLETVGDGESSEVVVIGEVNTCKKNKQPIEYNNDFQKHIKNDFLKDHVGSSANYGSENKLSLDLLDDNIGVYEDEMGDYEYEYEYDDYDYEESEGYGFVDDDNGINDDYVNNFDLSAQFDDLNLPPGVEAHVPWLANTGMASEQLIMDDEALRNYKQFKQFDTVKDYSDHYYTQKKSIEKLHLAKKPSKDWVKRIQHEWKVLENDLPEAIFVRVYEERMDLLRAVIIGPAGTPYHDGLFFFDVAFPSNYPDAPPMVHYHSGGLRLNPNLYNCGKVCLSLLGTWGGKGCEKWNPASSTILQVLVSIQALVLNAKPFFNEPGFANLAGTRQGEMKSLSYNEEAFLLSCKTMMYMLRRPPMYFTDFVNGHFRMKGRDILVACRAYISGAQVGCVDGKGIQDVDEGDKSCSTSFRSSLTKTFEDLLMEFTVKGADCAEFLAQKVKAGLTNAPDTTLKL